MHSFLLFLTKILRITTANALAITSGLSLLYFVDDDVYPIAVVITVLSLGVFYYAAYSDIGEVAVSSRAMPWSLQVFGRRIWLITLNNALWLFIGLTSILFVTGMTMVYVTLLTLSGFVMLYIEGYRVIEEEAVAAQEIESTELFDVSLFLENTPGTVGE